MSKLNIPQAHFAAAQHYFDNTPGAVKYSKKVNGMPYSFVKVEGQAYASGYRLGAGAFGIVRMSENAAHENFALKVEGHGINDLDRSESDILKLVGYHYGFAERQLEKNITFSTGVNSVETDKKLYKVMKLLEGNDLIDEIYTINEGDYEYKNTLTQTQSLIIAIKSCQNLMKLHDLRIIHRDIKPENMKAKIVGNDITISYMDFGLSVILPPDHIIHPKKEIAGSPMYMAPEIYNEANPMASKGEASFASDVYALGTIFQEDLQLPAAVCEPMLKHNPRERISLKEAMNNLVALLEAQPDLDPHARAVITSVKGPRPLPMAPVARSPQVVNPQAAHKVHAPQHVLSVKNTPANRVRVMVDIQPGFKLKPVAPKAAPAVAKAAAPAVAKAAPAVAKAAPAANNAARPLPPKPVNAKVAAPAPVVAKAPAADNAARPLPPRPVVAKAPAVAQVAPVAPKAAPVAVAGKHEEVKRALIHRFEQQKANAPALLNLPAVEKPNPTAPVAVMKNFQKVGVRVF